MHTRTNECMYTMWCWKPNPGPLKGSQVLCTADTSPALRTDQKGLWAECSEVVKHLPSIVNTSYNITDNKEKKGKTNSILFWFETGWPLCSLGWPQTHGTCPASAFQMPEYRQALPMSRYMKTNFKGLFIENYKTLARETKALTMW